MANQVQKTKSERAFLRQQFIVHAILLLLMPVRHECCNFKEFRKWTIKLILFAVHLHVIVWFGSNVQFKLDNEHF